MKRISRAWLVLLIVIAAAPQARADEVTDWNRTMLRAALIAGTSPPALTRTAAIFQVAVFDAVNGLDPKYEHFFVDPSGAPSGASKRAAAVQAAYVVLTKIYGSGAPTPNATQQATFEARRTVSLTEIGQHESAAAIQKGVTWGETVANAVLAARSMDGSTATGTWVDGTAPGEWRRTPNLPVSPALSGVAGYIGISEQDPWAMSSPSTFRPGPPPALNSAQYVRDFNEVKMMGSASSPFRSPDQTIHSLFWNSATVSSLWNSVAISLLEDRDKNDYRDWDDHWNRGRRRGTLLENARVLGVLGVAMADAIIGCWDAKYHYRYWRPITAIREDDGNPQTTPDPTWVPMFATPGHPDYPSGHSCGSGAAGEVLAHEFGNRTRFTMESDQMLGVSRSFRSFSAAVEEVKNARIFSGIHFRTACEVGQDLGVAVARNVIENKFRRID